MTGDTHRVAEQAPPAVHARADLVLTGWGSDEAAALVNGYTNTGAASLAPGGGGGSHPAAPALCAACHQPAPACDHADALFAGVVAIDTLSEPGAWQRHRDDALGMRSGRVDAFHHSTEIDRG